MLSIPEAVIFPELSDPDELDAFVVPFSTRVCPGHKSTSGPALTVGVGLTVIICVAVEFGHPPIPGTV